jgi:hypothetical protein
LGFIRNIKTGQAKNLASFLSSIASVSIAKEAKMAGKNIILIFIPE